MSEATSAHTPGKPWRDSQRIGDIALAEAYLRESRTQRAGMIYILGEILTALHRQAEALHELNTNLFLTQETLTQISRKGI